AYCRTNSLVLRLLLLSPSFFASSFFTAPSTTELYTLSLHDALPIFGTASSHLVRFSSFRPRSDCSLGPHPPAVADAFEAVRNDRSEEHTSELQSRENLVCRLLLEKKKTTKIYTFTSRKQVTPCTLQP